jgi:peptidoglycan/LPS O-acetylase OafA/YrhL
VGFYRFILAIGVVFFHVGNANWIVGRIAVFCLYFISGFLICRVLDTSYRNGVDRLAAFYCNRALRLFPLYIAITAATILVLTLHGSTIFLRGSGTVTLLSPNLVGNFPGRLEDWLPIPHLISTSSLPLSLACTTSRPSACLPPLPAATSPAV